MQSVDDYLAEILAGIRPVPPRQLSLEEADGGVLAEDITAQCPLPPFDNSSMDGYAVRAADIATASSDAPVTLPVRGEVTAGDTSEHRLSPGSCLRITTGAPLPDGADAVVPVELTDGGTAQVAFSQPMPAGGSVRRAGGDAAPGDVLLGAGVRLGPAPLGLLAAAGRAAVLGRPRPRVAVFSTGNELASPGTPLARGQILGVQQLHAGLGRAAGRR